jgi:hypothetical protein
MNRTSMVIIIGLLASLMGFGKEPPSQQAEPSANTFIIDYAHKSGSVFYHGTFSLIGGKVSATWTINKGGEKS